MEARRLLENAMFEPETLSTIFEAFDRAWSSIAHHIDGCADRELRSARLRLAHAVLLMAREESRDASQLEIDALRLMALAYPAGWPTVSDEGRLRSSSEEPSHQRDKTDERERN